MRGPWKGRAKEGFMGTQESNESNTRSQYELLSDALVFEAAGYLDQAEKSYREAIAVDPNFGEAYEKLSEIIIKKHQASPAREMATKAISLGLKTCKVYTIRGICFLLRSDFSKAVEDFTTALEIMPHNAAAQTLLENARQGCCTPDLDAVWV